MIKLFLLNFRKRIKSPLPNPNLEYRIIFKKGAVDIIKKAKGWRTDAEMARALGLTRAYISMLVKTKAGITATVITRLAVCLGNIEGKWWEHFEIIPYGVLDQNHPVWNEEKYKGRVPYARWSPSAQLREKEYRTETETTLGKSK